MIFFEYFLVNLYKTIFKRISVGQSTSYRANLKYVIHFFLKIYILKDISVKNRLIYKKK